MLRVLLIILAVVSITLALALDRSVLYLVAVLLLLGAGVLFFLEMRRRHDDVPENFEPLESREDDLDALGILEIKPRARTAASTRPSSDEDDASEPDVDVQMTPDPQATSSESTKGSPSGDDTDQPSRPPVTDIADPFGPRKSSANAEQSSDSVLGQVREKAPRARIIVATAESPVLAEVLVPAFRSLRAAVNAYTVCLLREEETPMRYHVEAIVSQNSYARENGYFAAKEPMLAGHKALVPVVYPRVGAGGFPKNKLGYYHEPISVRQVAMVPVVPKNTRHKYILLVDTTNDGGLEAASVRVILEQYARLTSTILDSAAEGGLAKPDDEPRPRREIIEEEMERARSMSHPLSLALVFLNRGESLDDTDEDAVADAETAFVSKLRDVVIDARVERFGELTYGVFYHGAQDGIAGWAAGLQASFEDENGVLEGGVSVGVALMTERHDGPDQLRSDATAALQESFETGECTIVE